MHRRRARPAAAARAGRPFSVRSLGAGRRSAAGWLLRSVKVRRCSIPKAPNPIEMVPTPTVCGVRSACTWRRSVAAHLSAKSLTASIHSSKGYFARWRWPQPRARACGRRRPRGRTHLAWHRHGGQQSIAAPRRGRGAQSARRLCSRACCQRCRCLLGSQRARQSRAACCRQVLGMTTRRHHRA